LPNDLNAKHGDGNGNGIINDEDLDRNISHYLYTNPYYEPEDHYPVGPEIVLTSNEMINNGQIRNIRIRAGIDIQNVLGLAYEIDFDTSIYTLVHFRSTFCPADSDYICLSHDAYFPVDPYFDISPRYSFVKTDHQATGIESDFIFDICFGGLALKEGISYDAIPDTVIIRLKNLIAIDAEGNDLHIGATPLLVPKQEVVGFESLGSLKTFLYPNPVQGFIHLVIDLETEAQLFSIQGHLLKHFDADQVRKPLDVSDMQPGIYILRIIETGESIKVVLQ